ncbi:MAG: GNAT family N-acetyltransferase [Bacteroidetes bacterium]|nr:MAG: GNAT family N-acetyltransferase [Bacteroidota bacterium]
MTAFLTEPLNSSHKKSDFRCGYAMLDRYLHKQAKQDVKRKLSACFILSDTDHTVKGYYTLSNAGISRSLIPEEIKNRLPLSYESLPVTLLGRLAVSELFKGQGLGSLLLIDALKRSYIVSNTIGSMAVVVDPIDEHARTFYARFQFIELPGSGKMFLPMKTIEQLFI